MADRVDANGAVEADEHALDNEGRRIQHTLLEVHNEIT